MINTEVLKQEIAKELAASYKKGKIEQLETVCGLVETLGNSKEHFSLLDLGKLLGEALSKLKGDAK